MRNLLKLIAVTHPRFTAVLMAVLLFAAPALAHDPYEITADLHFVEDRLEVMITQMHLTALSACSLETKNRRNFSSRQFEQVKAKLEKCARGAIDIKSAQGRLDPTSVAATMNKEGEIEFRLVYSRPTSGAVNVNAVMLRPLADPDYVIKVTVLVDGQFRSQHALQLGNSEVEITLPAPETPKVH